VQLVAFIQQALNIRCVQLASTTTVCLFLYWCIISSIITRAIAETASDVPMFVLRLRGMTEILFGKDADSDADITGHGSEPNVEDITSAILDRAKVHQSQASKPRLHNTVRTAGSIRSSSTSISNVKNLDKANSVVAERKKKAEEAKLTEVGIRIAATLWILDNSSKSKKAKTPTQV
jgi:hypothetical protein